MASEDGNSRDDAMDDRGVGTDLAQFMRSSLEDLSGPPDSSEDDDGGPDGGQATDEPSLDTDDPEDTGGETPTERPSNDSRSRLLRNIARIERSKTELSTRLRDVEAENARLRTESDGIPDVERLRERTARAMGLQPNDPRVSDRLFDLSQQITIAHLGDALDGDESLKAARTRLTEERKRQDERQAQERRIRELEERDRQLSQRERERETNSAISEMLRESPRPFLQAAVDDAPALVQELAREAIVSGRVRADTVEEAAALVQQIADNLDRHHRGRAEHMARLLRSGKTASGVGSSDGDIGDIDMTTDVRSGAASTKRPGGTKPSSRNATSNGGGGRGRPSVDPGSDSSSGNDEMDLNSFMKRQVEVLRRGRRTGR